MSRKKILALTLAVALTTGGFLAKEVAAETYKIQSGDTLYSISQQFNTTVESLMEINQLSSYLIYADDTIEISSDGEVYMIESGDTLFEIAMAYNTSVKQLQAWNGLNTDLIYAGEALAVSGSIQVNDEAATQVSTPNEAPVTKSESEPIEATTSQRVETSAPPSDAERTMTVEATAYTAYCNGCSGTTANGTDLRANPHLKVIAVDPRVIPLGTKVWVEGYGEAVAADTGGVIKGNKIDVFIPNKSGAYEWGRRTVTIKILN